MIGEEGAPSYGVMGTNLQATPHQPAFRNVPTPFTYKLLAVAGRLAAGRKMLVLILTCTMTGKVSYLSSAVKRG